MPQLSQSSADAGPGFGWSLDAETIRVGCVGSRVRIGSRHIGEGRDDRLPPGRAFQLGYVDCQLLPTILPMCFRADFNRGTGNAASLRPKLPSRLSVAGRLRGFRARCAAGGCEEYRNHRPHVLHRMDILSQARAQCQAVLYCPLQAVWQTINRASTPRLQVNRK
jgi:hypothetical protein